MLSREDHNSRRHRGRPTGGCEVKKTPTVYDVAEAAGVSTATVSFAFRRPDRVKESTRQAVHTAARALGYVPSASARGLAAGRTGAIGFVTWDLLAPRRHDGAEGYSPVQGWESPDANDRLRLYPRYVDEVQHGVEQAAWRKGYALMMGGGNHENNAAIIIDIAGRVDGLVILPHTIDDRTIRLIAQRTPVVIIAETVKGQNLSSVTVDNAGGIRGLVEHLVDDHDAQTMEFFAATQSVDQTLRFRSFQETLTSRNLRAPDRPLDSAGSADHVVDRLLRSPLPDAVVCGTDPDALELMDALTNREVSVPGDLIVTGFDGIAAGQVSTPRLTTIRQPMHAMGVAAVEIVIERLQTPDVEPRSRHFPVELLLRESCGCAPNNNFPQLHRRGVNESI
jgi:DNA-binding LacI/PurR family transcriptional regulator